MTNEELVESYQEGNEYALEELLLQNKNFLWKIARKFYIDWNAAIDIEDLVQEGYVGLITAAKRYACGEGLFITYAGHWVYQSMHRFLFPRRSVLTKLKEKGYDRSLYEKVTEDFELQDSLGDDPYLYDKLDNQIDIKQELSQVMDVVRSNVGNKGLELLQLRYGLVDGIEHTTKYICKRLGLSYKEYRSLYSKCMRDVKDSEFGRNKRKDHQNEVLQYSYNTGKLTSKFFTELFKDI